MANEKLMAERNLLVEYIAGSQLYGFSTPESDEDFRGVFVPDKDYILGLKKIEQVQENKPDRVLYAVGKFFELALANNPNIIEGLYVPENKMIKVTELWKRIAEKADLFLSKKCKYSFSGYAHAQLKRIHTHKKWIDDPCEDPPKKENYINIMTLTVGEKAQFIQSGWDEIELIGADEGISEGQSDFWGNQIPACPARADIQYFRKDEYEAALRKHHQYLDWKKNRNPARAALEASYGFDGKHAAHLIRLLKMAVEILKEGVIHVDRTEVGDVQLYRDIRNGKYTYDQITGMANDLEAETDVLYENSTLQFSPDINQISLLLVEVYDRYLYHLGKKSS